ncbi:MAG: ribosome maturation factor RimP [Candidatus Omnitrophota bacterium]
MINQCQLQDKLKAVIGEYLKGENIVLVNLSFKPRGRKNILRILVDEPNGGISLERCAALNNAITGLLANHSLIPDNYILEVSSPGIDRPLVTSDDFSRCLNHRVRIFFHDFQEDKNEIAGLLVEVTDKGVSLEVDGQIHHILFSQIRHAKQIIGEIK